MTLPVALARRRSALFIGALLLLLSAGVERATGKEGEGILDRAVAEALRATKAEDTASLRALLALGQGRPFLIAEVLCARSPGAARVFADAAHTPDTRALPAYVTWRLAHPQPAAGPAALLAGALAFERQRWSSLTAEPPGELDGVSGAALTLWHAMALRIRYGQSECVPFYLSAAREALKHGWLWGGREGLFDGAVAARRVSQFQAAISAFARLGIVERRRQRPFHVAQATFFEGGVRSELGQYAQALECFERAQVAWARLGEGLQVGRTLRLMSAALRGLGEYGRAQALAERAVELAGAPRERARALMELGTVHRSLGEYEEARRAYEAALGPARTLKRLRTTAGVLGNLGFVRMQLGAFKAAREALVEARDIYMRENDVRHLATAWVTLGHLAMAEGDLKDALALCLKGVQGAREANDAWILSHATHSLGEVLRRLKRPIEAREAFEGSVKHARALGARGPLLDGLLGLAQVDLRAGNAAGALVASREGMALINQMLAGLAEGQDAEAKSQHARLFEVAVDAAAVLDDAAAFADVVEMGRAMGFLASLEGRDELRAMAIPPAHRDAERAAQAAVAEARTLLRLEYRAGTRKTIRARRQALDDAVRGMEGVVARIRRAAKHRATVVYPEADDLAALQSRLRAAESLVLYALGAERYYALVIEPKRARIVTLAEREEIDAATAALAVAVEERAKDATSRGKALAGLVVAPLALAKSTHRMLTSPVGSLFRAPLPALSGGRVVTYVPSGTVYGLLRAAPAHDGTQVLALGGVDYAAHRRLSPLPGTGKEARAVGDTVLLGPRATEAGLRKALAAAKPWEAVHLACHGLLDQKRPMQTALALTPAAPDDGLLSVLELFSLEVKAGLVVLSACESGRGQVYRAEGIVGLTRAFMYAGAPRVICSLWKVDDEATFALMKAFYAHWHPKEGPGVSPAEALSAAQAEIRAQPKWSEPYYWAAWVIWGRPD